MTTLLITSIEDVREYVKTHPETRIGVMWKHMLVDMDSGAYTEYTILGFLAQADYIHQHAYGASLDDILVEGSGR